MTADGTTASAPLVRKLEGFGRLPEADRATLETLVTDARRVAAGTELIREGDPPAGVILVVEGFAGRYKLRRDGLRQIMACLVPGDFCDLDAAFLSRMDHSIAALSACRVARIAPATVHDLMQRPALARALRLATLVDAATAREWLVSLGRRSAVERLAHLFCELLARLGTVGLSDGASCDLPVTQAALADMTGMTLVHVNRSLGELRRHGLLELRDRRLTVRDMARLRDLAEFQPHYLHLEDRPAA